MLQHSRQTQCLLFCQTERRILAVADNSRIPSAAVSQGFCSKQGEKEIFAAAFWRKYSMFVPLPFNSTDVDCGFLLRMHGKSFDNVTPREKQKAVVVVRQA